MSSSSDRRSSWTRIAPWLLVAVLLGWLVAECRGQSVETDVQAQVEVWTSSERCYRNRLAAEAGATGRWGPVRARAFMDVIWWGACDAKVAGSLLNAEAGRVVERRHGAELYVQQWGVQLGGTIRRRAVHHIWRRKDRHPWFPGNWEIGRRGCNGEATPSHPVGDGCPSIGYADGLRPRAGYEGDGLDVVLYGPLWSWKDSLTLPWSDWIARAVYDRGPWTTSVEARWGGPADWSVDGGLRREVIGPVELGIRVGQVASPIWTDDNLQRLTTTITID